MYQFFLFGILIITQRPRITLTVHVTPEVATIVHG